MAELNAASDRLVALRTLLGQAEASTQDELREELKRRHFKVNQSTISRDLRRLGAVKILDAGGRTVYKLPEDGLVGLTAPRNLREMLVSIEHNESLIVIHTTPGSASLIARHLDEKRPASILGTLAGDDTIFVAPSSGKNLKNTCRLIEESLE